MGCEQELANPIVIEGIPLKRCPILYTGDKETVWIQAYFEYQNGHYPEPGAWLDQTIKSSALIRFIDATIERIRKAKEDGRTKHKH